VFIVEKPTAPGLDSSPRRPRFASSSRRTSSANRRVRFGRMQLGAASVRGASARPVRPFGRPCIDEAQRAKGLALPRSTGRPRPFPKTLIGTAAADPRIRPGATRCSSPPTPPGVANPAGIGPECIELADRSRGSGRTRERW